MRPPINILFPADQMRLDCLGATGNGIISTPNIDAVASKGTVLGYQNRFPYLTELLSRVNNQTMSAGKLHFNPISADLNNPLEEPGKVNALLYLSLEKVNSQEGNSLNNHAMSDWRKIKPQHYGMISLIDDSVGRVLMVLGDEGISEETKHPCGKGIDEEMLCLCRDCHKITEYRDSNQGEIFDLKEDPHELINLWGKDESLKCRLLLEIMQAGLNLKMPGANRTSLW